MLSHTWPCCGADEDEEEGTGEDDSDILPAESASSAATYWDKLLRHHWQALEKEEGAPNRIGEPAALPMHHKLCASCCLRERLRLEGLQHLAGGHAIISPQPCSHMTRIVDVLR